MAELRNSEGYIDLTAYIAHKNIEREERSNALMSESKTATIMRGDVWYVEKFNSYGSEQESGRPAVIVSNDMNNACSPVVEVVYLTTQPKTDLPTHVTIRSLGKPSTALCEQITAVYTERLQNYTGRLSDEEMAKIDMAMQVCLGLDAYTVPVKTAEKIIDPNPEMVEQVAQSHKEIDRLMNELKKSNEEIRKLTETNIALCGERDEAIANRTGHDEDLEALQDEAANWKNMYEALEHRYNDLSERATALATEVAQNKTPYPAYEDNLRKAERAAAVFRGKLELMRELYSELVAATVRREASDPCD